MASDVNRFAAEHDIEVDRAYELLVSVGFGTLDGLDVGVYVEDDRLILECAACATAFEDPDAAVAHSCDDG